MSFKGTFSSLSYNGWQSLGVPSFTSFATIQSNDIANGDYFGSSIDISYDNNYLIIGANNANVSNIDALGAAYFFYRTGNTTFVQANKLTPLASDYGGSPRPKPEFGTSVTISGDGNYVAIGSPASYAFSQYGAVYFYQRSGNSLNYLSTIYSYDISPIGSNRNYFGSSVDLNYSGNTILIGCDDNNGELVVCTRAGNVWSYSYTLYPSPNVGGTYYGQTAIISANSNTAAVSAAFDDSGGNNAGAIYIYDITSATQNNKLLGTNAIPMTNVLDLDSTGNFVAYRSNVTIFNIKNTSNVTIFSSNTLSTLGSISSVSISSDARFSGAGQAQINATPANVGNVYLYSNIANTSNLELFQNIRPPSNTANQYFGSQMKISNDGNYVFITAGQYFTPSTLNKVYAYIRPGI